MIKTKAQYQAVASRMEQINNAPAGSEAAKELNILSSLITEFESRRQQLTWSSPPEQFNDKLHRL